MSGAELHPAVLNFNGGHIYVRDVTTTGYNRAIVSLATPDQSAAYRLSENEQREGIGPRIEEYASQKPLTLFESKATALRLPVSDPPEIEAEQVGKWANVVDFGADPTVHATQRLHSKSG